MTHLKETVELRQPEKHQCFKGKGLGSLEELAPVLMLSFDGGLDENMNMRLFPNICSSGDNERMNLIKPVMKEKT